MSQVHNDWQTIFQHLKDEGYAVYSMGQHKGLCKSPYIVLKRAGTNDIYSVADRLYELLLYVPADEYSCMEIFVNSVKRSMQKLHPYVQIYEDEAPDYLDDGVKGYMTSMVYRAPMIAPYIGIYKEE